MSMVIAKRRLLISALPGFTVLITTVAVSLALGQPSDLFHTSSARGLIVRSLLITCILAVTVPIAPRIVTYLSHVLREKTPVGQLIKTSPPRESELERVISWFLRPIQGIGLCLIAGEEFIELLEYGTGLSYSEQLARASLFVFGSLIVAFLLSIVWTLDDLGLKIYGSSGDLNSAGNNVGTILPIVTGAIGITNLFKSNTPIVAIYNLAGLIFALYPPYLVFAVIHDEYMRPKIRRLHDSLNLRKLEAHLS
jgi:hypothetical protein